MPIAKKDWPIEEDDHLILEPELNLRDGGNVFAPCIAAGTGGMVTKVDPLTGEVTVRLDGLPMKFSSDCAVRIFKLYRRSQDSKRRQ